MNGRDGVVPVGLLKQFYPYLVVILIIGLATLVLSPLSTPQSYHIVSFILLFVVALLSVFLGIGPVLLAATMSAVSWNYFFIPPFHTFHIAKTEDRLMFISFFIIALLNGILTNRIRKQERAVREREAETNALFLLTGELSKTRGTGEVMKTAAGHFMKQFSADAWFFIHEGSNSNGNLILAYESNPAEQPDKEIASRVFSSRKKAGKHTGNIDNTSLTYYPLTGARINTGVVAFRIDEARYRNKDAFWDTYCLHIANALEREFLGEMAIKARVLAESDRFYGTLFNLVSHEFRIPIAAIMGASDTLALSQTSESNRQELYGEILKAAARLNHMTENLLNMSRIESGRVSLRLDWHDVTDLFNRVTQNLKQELEPFRLITTIPEDMPLVRIDFTLMEHILINLLLNSSQNSPAGSTLNLEASYDSKSLIMKVSDNGPGFPDGSLDHLFNKFFRVEGSPVGGLGLGLSIVKGLVDVHKGTVSAENLTTGGAMFTITIPSEMPDMNQINLTE
jgi:two-component system sensor histidine kinase KdpD